MAADSRIDVLQLVTTVRPFFEQQLSALDAYGVSSTVLTVPHSDGERRSVLDYARFHREVARMVLGEDFDLVHANYGLTAPAALAQPTRPVVLSLWGSDLFGTYGPVSRFCASFCDAVVVMTDDMADEIDRDPSVIPHGIDLERFSTMPVEQARDAVGWDATARHVLFPYDPSRSVKNYPLAEAVVSDVEDRLSEPVVLHAVFGVPHERMPMYMNAADALLLTSDHEGSPNAVREALACDLPVVATDVGDVRAVVAGIENCAVCATETDLARTLGAVLEAGERADGRQRAREFGFDRMGRELRTVYDEVLDAE